MEKVVNKETAFGRLYWDRKPEGVPSLVTHKEFVGLYPDVSKYLPESGPQVVERHPERWVCYFQLDRGGLMPEFSRMAEVWMLPDDGMERAFRLLYDFGQQYPLRQIPIKLELLSIPAELRESIKGLINRKRAEDVEVTAVCSWIEPDKLTLSVGYGLFTKIDPMDVMSDVADALSRSQDGV